MNNKNSIVPIGNNQIKKVTTSIDLTKKIISQGNVVEQKYSKIKVIPYLKEGIWYLFNPKAKRFLEGTYQYFKRKRDYILCLDYHNKYWLFKQDKIRCHFQDFTDSERSWCPDFEIIDNENIVLWYNIPFYGRKYIAGWRPRIEGVLNLNGVIIELEVSKEDLEFYSNNKNSDDIKLKDTLWEVNEEGLYFKNQKKFNSEDAVEISVSDFHYGYAFVEDIIDVDPEFGLTSRDIGFIDVYGNHYWE